MGPDLLEEIRSALARHDWQGAFDAARVVAVDDPALAAERDDLLAEAAWWLGRLDDCIEAREAAYRGFDELGDSRRAGQCAVWLYEHHLFRARPAIAGGWLQRARRSLEGDTECEAHGALQLREAEAAHGRAAFDVALDLARPALAVGRALRSANLEAEALQTIGRVLIDQGHVVEGMAHLDEAMLFAVEGRLGPYSTGKVYCSLISVCEDLGDLDRAAEWTEATMTWAHQHPFAIFPGICRVHRAVVLKRRGSLAEAEVEAARAAEELLGSHLGNTAAAYAEVGDICRRLGQLERAEAAFAQAEELRGQPCGAVALLRVAQGRTDAALAIVTGCLQSSATPLGRATLLPIVVQVAIAAGELDLARSARVELDEVATALGTPLLLATALAARGRVELATGDAAAARTTFEEVAERWTALDVPYEVATARTLLGQALTEVGDERAAAAAFAVAAELFDRIGAHLDAAQVGHRAAPTRPAGLTEREVEVLRLIAQGMSNSEIAAALFLSVKTVSRHLSNIFTKIGVTSRAGATAFAFEHELVDARR